MIRRRTLGIGAALAVLGSAALLISGHPLLNWPEAGLPLGTLVAGVLVSGLGVLPLAIAPPQGFAGRLALAICALALAWLPATLLFAGNLRLNFSSDARGEWATALGLVTLSAILLGLLVSIVERAQHWWRAR